jgi:catechol 2,3-dioxygenase-like lactoylglutathione lyase family enzyme
MPEFRVIVLTDRFDACEAFYRALGCPVTGSWDDHGRGRIFQVEGGDGRIEIIEVPEGEAVPAGAGVAFEVVDVEAHRAATAAAGLEPSSLEDQPWGHRSDHLTDPAGLGITAFQVIAPER